MATRQLALKFSQGSANASADSAVLDAADWGMGVDDSVRLSLVGGEILQFNWEGVLYVREGTVPPAPPIPPFDPPLPNWVVSIRFGDAPGASEYVVSPAVQAQLLLDLEGPSSEDQILTFDTLDNYRLRLPTKALASINFEPQV